MPAGRSLISDGESAGNVELQQSRETAEAGAADGGEQNSDLITLSSETHS